MREALQKIAGLKGKGMVKVMPEKAVRFCIETAEEVLDACEEEGGK